MSILCDQLTRVLQPGMSVPDPIRSLYEWLEQTRRCVDTPQRNRIGMLPASWPTASRDFGPGTKVLFQADGNAHLHHWFGHSRPEVLNRLCVFARTGSDGSMGAFWLDDDGMQRIVQMGSGSGSTSVCILAEDPIDFLRLLAIGYDEICWSDDWSLTPQEAAMQAGGDFSGLNDEYNDWLMRTFAVSIPERGTEIVRHPSEMHEANTEDRFCQWVNKALRES
ncbi:MAG TPA: hypothetical protein VHN77_10250 [Phycisphaerales bacterium]|nr:hypothetical protein [Phycisphaerales bacterium]